MLLTLPGTLQTSEQFFKSSAKQTEPDWPPKKNKLFVLSVGLWTCWPKTRVQKTIWLIAPSRVYWQTGVIPLWVRQTAQVPFRSPVTSLDPSLLKVILLMLDLWIVLSSRVSLSSSFHRVRVPSSQPMARAWIWGCHLIWETWVFPRWIWKLGTTTPSSLMKTIRGRLVATASTTLNSLLDHDERRACSSSKRTC